MTKFAENLLNLMEQKNLKKSDLSREAGISYTTLDSWLKREDSLPKIDVCFKVAKYLGVTVEYLITGESEEPKAIDPLIAKIQKLTPEQKEDIEDLVDVKLAKNEEKEQIAKAI